MLTPRASFFARPALRCARANCNLVLCQASAGQPPRSRKALAALQQQQQQQLLHSHVGQEKAAQSEAQSTIGNVVAAASLAEVAPPVHDYMTHHWRHQLTIKHSYTEVVLPKRIKEYLVAYATAAGWQQPLDALLQPLHLIINLNGEYLAEAVVLRRHRLTTDDISPRSRRKFKIPAILMKLLGGQGYVRASLAVGPPVERGGRRCYVLSLNLITADAAAAWQRS